MLRCQNVLYGFETCDCYYKTNRSALLNSSQADRIFVSLWPLYAGVLRLLPWLINHWNKLGNEKAASLPCVLDKSYNLRVQFYVPIGCRPTGKHEALFIPLFLRVLHTDLVSFRILQPLEWRRCTSSLNTCQVPRRVSYSCARGQPSALLIMM